MRTKAKFFERSAGRIEITGITVLFDIDDETKGYVFDTVFSNSVSVHLAKELMEARVKYAVKCLASKEHLLFKEVL